MKLKNMSDKWTAEKNSGSDLSPVQIQGKSSFKEMPTSHVRIMTIRFGFGTYGSIVVPK